jgi:hypothetical protein
MINPASFARRAPRFAFPSGSDAVRACLAGVAAAGLLSACVVREPVYYAPPPRVYAPPPAPYTPPPAAASPDQGASASEAPPPLPQYEQPPCPEEGFLWAPGYWANNGFGYYWVPGTWVEPPRAGFLWTPGYWGFAGGVYVFNAGYWGPHVGYYGGINYGFGYGGYGYGGGRWDGDHFAYNTAVNNVNVTVVHNTYNQTIVNNNVTVNNTSYNGGAGGVQAAPTAQERAIAQEPHVAPTPAQIHHVQQAAANPALAAHANGGHPAIAATPRPGAFSGPGIVPAHGAPAVASRVGVPPSNSSFRQPPASGAAPAASARSDAFRPAQNGSPEVAPAAPNGASRAPAAPATAHAPPPATANRPAAPKPAPKTAKHEPGREKQPNDRH